jgi:anti-sigma regulatory factor (Ser/Thr protein kinase)
MNEAITVAARHEALAKVEQLLDLLAARHRFNADAVADVQVALDEVLSGIVRQASAAPGEHLIHVAFRLRGPRLEAEVQDDGEPFDPLQPAAAAGAGEEPQQGLNFVRKLMDDVRYQRAGEHNHLVLAKRVL